MRILTKSNVADVIRDYRDLGNDYRKAIASGLNKTAFRVAFKDMPGIMEKGIDRPVQFTKRKPAFYTKAQPYRLKATVELQRIQTDYLQNIVFGGKGRKGKAVPVSIRVNKFGNIASLKDGKKVQQLLTRPNVFAKTIRGVAGIWQKRKSGLQLLIYFSRGTYRYRKQFDWHRGVINASAKRLPNAMDEAINKVINKYARRAVSRVL